MTFTSRNVVRRLAHRSVDWSASHFKANPEIAASVSAFRTWAASADSMAEKFAAPPAPIDFKKYEGSVRDAALFANLESFYKSYSPAPEVYEWDDEDKADKMKQIEDAKAQLSFTQEMLNETVSELEFMKSNRTTLDSDGTSVKDAYPDIAEETEKEIEERRWFKDAIQ